MSMPVTRDDVVAAASRLRGRVRRTPLIESHALSAAAGRPVWLKLEILQHTRSFKYRGALHVVLRRDERVECRQPLVTASAGNHGLALASAAALLQVPLRVFVPRTAPAAKVERLRELGADLDLESRDYDDAEGRALTVARGGEATYVSPYAHPDVIAGAGTVGLEILEELPDAKTIVVPTGGGGLLSGIALAADGRPQGDAIAVVGVEPGVNPAFSTSLAAGAIRTITPGASLADGLLGNLEPGAITFDLVRRHATDVRTVAERDIVAGVRTVFQAERLVAEGAGAIAVGALLAGQLADLPAPIVLVLSGANIDAAAFCGAVSA